MYVQHRIRICFDSYYMKTLNSSKKKRNMIDGKFQIYLNFRVNHIIVEFLFLST